jgi:hypothetical protein
MFPACESHYSRSYIRTKYLSLDLCITETYQLHKEYCKEKYIRLSYEVSQQQQNNLLMVGTPSPPT